MTIDNLTDKVVSITEIIPIISNNIREVLQLEETESIATDVELVDMGANSVDRTEIIQMTLENLEADIPMVSFFGMTTVEKMAQHICDSLN